MFYVAVRESHQHILCHLHEFVACSISDMSITVLRDAVLAEMVSTLIEATEMFAHLGVEAHSTCLQCLHKHFHFSHIVVSENITHLEFKIGSFT